MGNTQWKGERELPTRIRHKVWLTSHSPLKNISIRYDINNLINNLKSIKQFNKY